MQLIEFLIQVRGGREGRHEADETARGFEHLRRASEEAKVSSVTLGVGLDSVSSRLKLATLAAVFLGPALLSIGMSAGAAMIGGGIVGGGGLAALIVGMSGFVLIGKSVAKGAKDVSSALDAYHLSVAQTGRYSDQSMKALQRLDAVVATSGGPKVLAAVRAWSSLKGTFNDLTGTARGALLGTYKDALTAAGRLMPTFAKETNRNSLSIRASLKSAFGTFSGAEAQGGLSSLSKTFRQAQGPGMRGVVDLIVTLLRYFKAAGPYVVEFSRGFASWAHEVRGSSSDVDRVNGRVAMFVGHLRSWGALIGALGHLTRTVFGQSQASGKGLVDMMTVGVRRFDAWIASGDRGKKTFQKSAQLMVTLGDALVPLAHLLGVLADAAMPGVTSAGGGLGAVFLVLNARVQIFAAVLRLLGPLAGPLVMAFVAWKIAVIALNVAMTVLDFLLTASGFTLIVAAVLLVAAAFYLIYTNVGWVRHAISDAFNWIKSNWPTLLIALTGPFGLAVVAIIKNFGTIKSAFRAAINFIIKAWNGLNFHVGIPKKVFGVSIPGGGHGISINSPDIPLLAEGGVSRMSGSAIVGEAGPEMVDLPAGAVVSPLGRGGDVVLNVDGREWARVTRRQMLAAQAGA